MSSLLSLWRLSRELGHPFRAVVLSEVLFGEKADIEDAIFFREPVSTSARNNMRAKRAASADPWTTGRTNGGENRPECRQDPVTVWLGD